MDIMSLSEHCLAKWGVSEEFPFDQNTLVFKVATRIFAIFPLDKWEKGEPMLNLKCEPYRALVLREKYPDILPGYHMNKKHWNTLYLSSGELPQGLVLELIDHSYQLVYDSLPRKQKILE